LGSSAEGPSSFRPNEGGKEEKKEEREIEKRKRGRAKSEKDVWKVN